MPAWPRSCVTAAAPCRESMSRRQRNLRVRSSTKPRGIVSSPDFVPLSGSDHAVSIARSVNASSSHGRPAGCRAPRPQRRPGWPPDRCVRMARRCMCRALIGRCRLAGRARVAVAETPPAPVRAPLPHHSTACRSDRPSSEVIVCSASPARLSVSRTAPSRSPSAVSTATKTFEPAFPVGTFPCAVLPGHPTPTAAPLASSTDDSSLDISSLESLTRPKPQTRH